jgi:hypothetical protein
MTATIAPEMNSFWQSPSSWRRSSRTTVLVVPTADTTGGTGTFARSPNVSEWKRAVVGRAARLLQCSPSVGFGALGRLVELVDRLPGGMPAPFVTVGDEGLLTLEWDVRGFELHISFSDDCDEVYFRSPAGDEWEGTLAASARRLMSAVRQVVGAS